MPFFFCAFCCQVEEEASDKDNKNCSNNGKQPAGIVFCSLLMQHLCLRLATTQQSTRVKVWGARFLSKVNHDMYSDVALSRALNGSARQASWIMQELEGQKQGENF